MTNHIYTICTINRYRVPEYILFFSTTTRRTLRCNPHRFLRTVVGIIPPSLFVVVFIPIGWQFCRITRVVVRWPGRRRSRFLPLCQTRSPLHVKCISLFRLVCIPIVGYFWTRTAVVGRGHFNVDVWCTACRRWIQCWVCKRRDIGCFHSLVFLLQFVVGSAAQTVWPMAQELRFREFVPWKTQKILGLKGKNCHTWTFLPQLINFVPNH